MTTESSGRLISTASVTLLWINVIANIYNLVIISLSNEKEIQTLLGTHSDAKQIFVLIQTVLSICVIMISTIQRTSYLILTIKFSVFKSLSFLLIADIMLACTTTADIFSNENTLNEFWAARTDNKQLVAPDNLRYIVVSVSTTYLFFKLYVAYTTLRVAKKLHNNLSNDEYFHIQDVERNAPSEETVSSELPPSYDQCVTESESTSTLPPYSVVQKYIQKY